MTTLQDARDWHLAIRRNLTLFGALTRPDYWAGLPLGRDDRFKSLDAEVVRAEVVSGLPFLDDLAVVVLFSVFESQVRGHAVELLQDARAGAVHPVVAGRLEDAADDLREGSFYRLLEAFKAVVDKNLVEHVNQVRKYRNWVAHGRREDDPPDNVTPREAYARLAAFLAALGLG